MAVILANGKKAAQLGKNPIGNFIKTMAEFANVSGEKTNHSARKTSAERFLQANMPPTLIQNITGHKNVQNIPYYAKASNTNTLICKKSLLVDCLGQRP